MNKIIMYVVVFIIFVIIRIVAAESDNPMGSFVSYFVLAILLGIGSIFVKNSGDNTEEKNAEEEKKEEVKEDTETKE